MNSELLACDQPVSNPVIVEKAKTMNWWIIEDALRDRKGHWFEYLQTFRRGLAEEGDGVRFYASKECEPEVARAFDAEPVLPKSIWACIADGAPKWKRFLRLPAHGFATYRAVSKLLADSSALHAPLRPVGSPSQRRSSSLPAGRALPDLIFVPTALVHHLAGWVPLIKTRLRRVPTRVLLFFPYAPVDLDESGAALLAPEPTAKLFKMCIRLLAKDVAAGKVVLGAETRPMVKALSEVTGVPFTYLPHPVELAHSPATRDSVGHLGDPSPQTPVPATSSSPIVFGCYGAARYEKGSDILQAAIRFVLEKHPDIAARFVFQWVEDFRDASGRIVHLDPWLATHPKVEVIKKYFREGEYAERLLGTDVMVLPYRNAYRLRVSRVVIEALNLGTPVITTENTTLAQQAKESGVVKECAHESPEQFANAICHMVEAFPMARQRAQDRASLSQRHFSVSHFRKSVGNSRLSG